jgi:glycosyltransferase involved in cell wall biosynthesis
LVFKIWPTGNLVGQKPRLALTGPIASSSVVTPAPRRRLLIFNQYFFPGVEATAQLLTALAEALAADYEVTVVTGRLLGHEAEPASETRNGVQIVRTRSTAFDRGPLLKRAANYLTYLTGALLHGLRSSRPDVVLCMTDPPMIGDVAYIVARRFRVPLVVVNQDVFPEIAVRLKRLTNPALVQLLRVMTNFYLRRADRVVAIGETMRERLKAKGTREDRLRVIPNWVDTDAVTPQPRDNKWAEAHGLVDRFVVMHSGNVGHAQDLDTLVRASTMLPDVEDLAVVIIGTGARFAELSALARQLKADRVAFLPYQPREVVPKSLSSADVHFVGLGRGLSGYVVPSRLYGIMAVGRPVIAAAEEDSETAHLVREVDCGVVIRPGDPAQLAETIRSLASSRDELPKMGKRGRAYAEANADRSIAVERYRALLREVLPGQRVTTSK